MKPGRLALVSAGLIVVLSFVPPVPRTASAQEEPAEEGEEDPGFESEVETVTPIRLRSADERQRIEVIVHLWGVPSGEGEGDGDGEDQDESEPAPRTLEVVAETPPPFVRGLRILQAAPPREGDALDAPLRFVPGSTVTFAPAETARPLRLEFDLVKDAVAADARGLASGELVVVITSNDETVVPARRRLVLPLEFRPEGDPPETTGPVVQIWVRYSKPVEGGSGFMADGAIVHFEWEDPTPQNAHPYTGNDPYARLTWAEATEDLYVLASGSISGGIPPFEAEFELVGGYNVFHARMRDKHDFNILFPIEDPHAGTIRISGRLLAFDGRAARNMRDENRFDDSRVLASLPFEAEVTIPAPPLTGQGKARLIRSDGRVVGSVELTGLQPGRRVARVDAGGAPYFGYIKGNSGGRGSVSFRLIGRTEVPGSARVTFRNFGADVNVAATLETTVSSERHPPDPQDLARYQERLTKREHKPADEVTKVESAREQIASWHRQNAEWDAGPWISACNEWFAATKHVAAVIGDPNWAGYGGRPPGAEYLAKQRGYYARQSFFDRARAADGATEVGRIDVARAWLAACEADHAATFPEPDLAQRGLSRLASGYRRLASMTFHLTGDLEAANALDGYADALGQRARGEQPSAPKKPLFAVDPEYR